MVVMEAAVETWHNGDSGMVCRSEDGKNDRSGKMVAKELTSAYRKDCGVISSKRMDIKEEVRNKKYRKRGLGIIEKFVVEWK